MVRLKRARPIRENIRESENGKLNRNYIRWSRLQSTQKIMKKIVHRRNKMLGKTTTKKNLKRKRKWAILSLDSLIRARQTSSVITERTVTKRAKILTLTSLHLASMNDKTMSKTKSITRIINKFRRVVLSVRLPRLAKSAYIRCFVKMRKVTQIAIVKKIHSKSGSAIRMQRTQMLT